MSLQDQLMQDLKEAMKTGDETRKATIRLLRAAISAAEIEKRTAFVESQQAKGVEPESLTLDDAQFALTDEETLAVLQNRRSNVAIPLPRMRRRDAMTWLLPNRPSWPSSTVTCRVR